MKRIEAINNAIKNLDFLRLNDVKNDMYFYQLKIRLLCDMWNVKTTSEPKFLFEAKKMFPGGLVRLAVDRFDVRFFYDGNILSQTPLNVFDYDKLLDMPFIKNGANKCVN